MSRFVNKNRQCKKCGAKCERTLRYCRECWIDIHSNAPTTYEDFLLAAKVSPNREADAGARMKSAESSVGTGHMEYIHTVQIGAGSGGGRAEATRYAAGGGDPEPPNFSNQRRR